MYQDLEGKLSLNVFLMGWVMQELVYSLNYVLERMDLMRSWVDRGREGKYYV